MPPDQVPIQSLDAQPCTERARAQQSGRPQKARVSYVDIAADCLMMSRRTSGLRKSPKCLNTCCVP